MSRAGWPVALQGVHTPVVFSALQQRYTPQTCKEAAPLTHGKCVFNVSIVLLLQVVQVLYLHMTRFLI